MAATRYRDLQAPSLLQTGIADNSGAETALRLAETFKQFEHQVTDIGVKFQSEAGKDAGQAAGAAGQPDFKKGWRMLTAFGEAYNNAATRSYAIKAEADIEDTAARLEVEAANDPTKFQATMNGALQGMMEKAPAGTSGILRDLYNSRIAQGVSRLSAAQAQEVQTENQTTLSDGIERSIDRIGRGIASDNLEERQQAQEEQIKVGMLIDSAEADGTLSEVAAHMARKKVLTAITTQTVVARFKKELDDPYGDPAGFILDLKKLNQTSEALLPEEEAKLEDTLLTELREHNALIASAEQDANAEEEARWKAGDKAATEMLLDGSLTRGKLLHMVQEGDLKPEVARTLENDLEANASNPVSDQTALLHARVNLLSLSEDEILKDSRLAPKDRGDLVLERRKLADTWRSTQQAREGADRIDRALGLVPGMMLERLSPQQSQQRDQALTEWYDRVDALPEAERQGKAIEAAEDVAKIYIRKKASTRATQLRDVLSAYIKDNPTDGMSDSEKQEYNKHVDRLNASIASEEAKGR